MTVCKRFEVTGKAVIYTSDGVKVVPAEVRRMFNNHYDTCTIKFDYSGDYLLIGGARDVPTTNLYAQPAYNPERIQRAVQYTQTKFFRLMLDFMKLAQWQPIHKFNVPLEYSLYVDNKTTSLPSDDQSLYERWQFTPAMIRFTEEKFK